MEGAVAKSSTSMYASIIMNKMENQWPNSHNYRIWNVAENILRYKWPWKAVSHIARHCGGLEKKYNAVADPEGGGVQQVRAPFKFWSTMVFSIQFYIRMLQNKAQVPWDHI